MNFKSVGQWVFKPSPSPRPNKGPFLKNPFSLFTRPAVNPVGARIEEPQGPQDGHSTLAGPGQGQNTDTEEESKNHRSEDVEMATRKEMSERQKMRLEKRRYPGAEKWAKDEERLFEILYLRQTLPILPHRWNIDFLGAPMPENVFDSGENEITVVRALSEPEFTVTQSIEQLIYLTGDVLTATQSGHMEKAPRIIKRKIDQFINILAQDGGYENLEVLPNLFVEDIKGLGGEYISQYMQNRMKTLAKLQREFLRVDRAPDFWLQVVPDLMSTKAEKTRLLNKLVLAQKRSLGEAFGPDDGHEDGVASLEGIEGNAADATQKRRRLHLATATQDIANQPEELHDHFDASLASDSDCSIPTTPVPESVAGSEPADEESSVASDETDEEERQLLLIHSQPLELSRMSTKPPTIKYRRTPPVVYGFFIMGTSVFLLTVDSSKGEDAYVTYHLSMSFLESDQSVWNALTVAIVACRARDDLMQRLDDFEPKAVDEEADPDA